MRGRLGPALIVLGMAVFAAIPYAIPRGSDPVENSPAPEQISASDVEQIRAISWNICGEAGGATAADSGYCAYRNYPAEKVQQITALVRNRGLNVVMLQEVCFGTANSH